MIVVWDIPTTTQINKEALCLLFYRRDMNNMFEEVCEEEFLEYLDKWAGLVEDSITRGGKRTIYRDVASGHVIASRDDDVYIFLIKKYPAPTTIEIN